MFYSSLGIVDFPIVFFLWYPKINGPSLLLLTDLEYVRRSMNRNGAMRGGHFAKIERFMQHYPSYNRYTFKQFVYYYIK